MRKASVASVSSGVSAHTCGAAFVSSCRRRQQDQSVFDFMTQNDSCRQTAWICSRFLHLVHFCRGAGAVWENLCFNIWQFKRVAHIFCSFRRLDFGQQEELTLSYLLSFVSVSCWAAPGGGGGSVQGLIKLKVAIVLCKNTAANKIFHQNNSANIITDISKK